MGNSKSRSISLHKSKDNCPGMDTNFYHVEPEICEEPHFTAVNDSFLSFSSLDECRKRDCVCVSVETEPPDQLNLRNICISYLSTFLNDENVIGSPTQSLYDVVGSHKWTFQSQDIVSMFAYNIILILKVYGQCVPKDSRVLNDRSPKMFIILDQLYELLAQMKFENWNALPSSGIQSCFGCDIKELIHRHVNLRKKTVKKSFCLVCLKFIQKRAYSRHVMGASHLNMKARLIQSIYPFPCSKCSGRYCREEDLLHHETTHLPDSKSDIQTQDFQPICCYLCQVPFEEESDLIKHQNKSLEHGCCKEIAMEIALRSEEVADSISQFELKCVSDANPSKSVSFEIVGQSDEVQSKYDLLGESSRENSTKELAKPQTLESSYFCAPCAVHVPKANVISHERGKNHFKSCNAWVSQFQGPSKEKKELDMGSQRDDTLSQMQKSNISFEAGQVQEELCLSMLSPVTQMATSPQDRKSDDMLPQEQKANISFAAGQVQEELCVSMLSPMSAIPFGRKYDNEPISPMEMYSCLETPTELKYKPKGKLGFKTYNMDCPIKTMSDSLEAIDLCAVKGNLNSIVSDLKSGPASSKREPTCTATESLSISCTVSQDCKNSCKVDTVNVDSATEAIMIGESRSDSLLEQFHQACPGIDLNNCEMQCELCGALFQIYNVDGVVDIDFSIDMHVQNDPQHTLATAVPVDRNPQSLAEITKTIKSLAKPTAPKISDCIADKFQTSYCHIMNSIFEKILALEQGVAVKLKNMYKCLLCSATLKSKHDFIQHFLALKHLSHKWISTQTDSQLHKRLKILKALRDDVENKHDVMYIHFKLLLKRAIDHIYANWPIRENNPICEANKISSTSMKNLKKANALQSIKHCVNNKVSGTSSKECTIGYCPYCSKNLNCMKNSARRIHEDQCKIEYETKSQDICRASHPNTIKHKDNLAGPSFFCDICKRSMVRYQKKAHLAGKAHKKQLLLLNTCETN